MSCLFYSVDCASNDHKHNYKQQNILITRNIKKFPVSCDKSLNMLVASYSKDGLSMK